MATNDSVPGSATAARPACPTAADYAAAGLLLEGNLANLVRNATVAPRWLPALEQFWYKRDGEHGDDYVLVDAKTGAKSPLFDRAALATALGAALGAEISADALGLTGETISPDGKRLTAMTRGKLVIFDLAAMTCTPTDPPKPDVVAMRSPGGRFSLRICDHNAVLSDARGSERALTSDGVAHFAYGKLPDTASMVVPLQKGRQLPPFGAAFSPDERWLLVPRIDERDFAANPIVESVPADGAFRPIVHQSRFRFSGERTEARIELRIFATEGCEGVLIAMPPAYARDMPRLVGWSAKHGQLFLLSFAHGAKQMALLRVDCATGACTVLIEESADTRTEANSALYNRPNVRLLGDGDELLCYSDRSGWGHLYLHDAQSGALKRQVTAGDWLVQDIHRVDEDGRTVYFTGGGREPGRDPYYRHLYRAALDTDGDPVLLTATDADHHFVPEGNEGVVRPGMVGESPIRPDLGVFLDSWSTVDQPPVTALRSLADGSEIAIIERADASRLYAAGWKPPVRQAVKAADGVTDIYAVYYPPYGSGAGTRYPIVDAAYGGPQVCVAPRNFIEAYAARGPGCQSAFARLGIAGVTIDGRGTPLRSRAFRDTGYPEFTRIGIEDHVAAIRQLALRYPEIDLDHVGIQGWSWGGTFAAQAILTQPDFYKVSISGAGTYAYEAMYPGFEKVIGIPEYADGTHFQADAKEKPANWQPLDVTAMAGALKGRLLLIYGDLDENVPSWQAFRLIDALIKANKPYDLLCIPGGTHFSAHPSGLAYTAQRMMDYFVQHLLGCEPPRDAKVSYLA